MQGFVHAVSALKQNISFEYDTKMNMAQIHFLSELNY